MGLSEAQNISNGRKNVILHNHLSTVAVWHGSILPPTAECICIATSPLLSATQPFSACENG